MCVCVCHANSLPPAKHAAVVSAVSASKALMRLAEEDGYEKMTIRGKTPILLFYILVNSTMHDFNTLTSTKHSNDVYSLTALFSILV